MADFDAGSPFFTGNIMGELQKAYQDYQLYEFDHPVSPAGVIFKLFQLWVVVGFVGNTISFIIYKQDVDKQIEELKEGMTEEEQQQYFFQVILDEETEKPKVMKLLKPPMPIFEVKESDDPDTLGSITIKQPEISPEMKEAYE